MKSESEKAADTAAWKLQAAHPRPVAECVVCGDTAEGTDISLCQRHATERRWERAARRPHLLAAPVAADES